MGGAIRSKAEDARVKMLTINVLLDVWIEDKGLRNNNNPLNVRTLDLMNNLHLCPLASWTTSWSK